MAEKRIGKKNLNLCINIAANKPEHIKENLDIYDFQLTDKEMQEIGKIDCGKRYYYLEPDKAAKTYLGMKLDFDAQP